MMSDSSTRRTNSIEILPDEILIQSSEYLSLPSRALLALAIRSHCCSDSAQLQTTKLIIERAKWDILDFGELEHNLASKLTDADVSNMLIVIEARSSVKCLRLTGCSNLTGSGLRPLRNSAVMEEIDLRIVMNKDGQKQRLWQKEVLPFEMLLNEAMVVPILTSMLPRPPSTNTSISMSSLLLVHYPVKWRTRKSSILSEFLQAFERVLSARNLCCSHTNCNSFLCTQDSEDNDDDDDDDGDDDDDEFEFIGQEGDMYGLTKFISTFCRKPFCEDCLSHCEHCKRHACLNCDDGDLINICACEICWKCVCCDCDPYSAFCDMCGDFFCEDCNPVISCDVCDSMICMECKVFEFCSICDLSASCCTPHAHGGKEYICRDCYSSY